jgi:hypothetical protein
MKSSSSSGRETFLAKAHAAFTHSVACPITLRIKGEEHTFRCADGLVRFWKAANRPGKVEHAVDQFNCKCRCRHEEPVAVDDGPKAWAIS